jgi:hypothetical protein
VQYIESLRPIERLSSTRRPSAARTERALVRFEEVSDLAEARRETLAGANSWRPTSHPGSTLGLHKRAPSLVILTRGVVLTGGGPLGMRRLRKWASIGPEKGREREDSVHG